MSTEDNSSFVGRRKVLKAGVVLTGTAALYALAGCKPVTALPPAPSATAPTDAATVTIPLVPQTESLTTGHVVTDLCIRDGACAEVCPVECIVPGQPIEDWPWYYIDPDTCIDCGACIPECPIDAIFAAEDVPEDKLASLELNALFFIEGPGYAALDHS
jgi:ferredoxin